MKKVCFILCLAILSGCSFVNNEKIVGYNEQGKTVVEVCRGGFFIGLGGKSCNIELKDYGRVSNKSDTLNVISKEER